MHIHIFNFTKLYYRESLRYCPHVCIGGKTEKGKNIVVHMKNVGNKCFLTLNNLSTAIS